MENNNIFLTGNIKSGKTTLIIKMIKELQLDPAGFMVARKGEIYNWQLFYLLSAQEFCDGQYVDVKNDRVFATKLADGNWKIDQEIFNKYGVNFLDNHQNKDIFVMDELGTFESKAFKFQKKVLKIIKSNVPVIGVIKNQNSTFLDRVRDILDRSPLVVTEHNREYIYAEMKTTFKKYRR